MDSDCSKPINLGNPVEITVNELAMRITNKINAALPHVNLPLPEDDPQRRNPDITLAKETLDWLPTVSLDDGSIYGQNQIQIHKTIHYAQFRIL